MLNHAVLEPFRMRHLASIAVTLMLLGSAGSAAALDGIDLSAAQAETAEGECPKLVQIKYPFLSCANGQIGQTDADDTWENSRQIPMLGTWTESDGAYGPSLNQR